MSFFPLYIDMQDLKILVIGGGAIAMEKLEKLLDFTKDITIIANKVSEEVSFLVSNYSLTLYERKYQEGDTEGFDIVVIATDTVDLHQSIYKESRRSKILVNSVDSMAFCDFIFPSYIQRGDLTIAFSTGGVSPAFSKQIRAYFDKNIPNSVERFLHTMKTLRKNMPKGKERMRYFDTLVKNYFSEHFK